VDLLFSVLLYGVGGFFCLILLLFILAIMFGKRIDKQWEYEAKFLNDKGREIAEFDIESSRIAKQEREYSLKVEFQCRHTALNPGDRIEVYLEELLVVAGEVKHAGRIRLGNADLVNSPTEPGAGQICYIKHNQQILLQQALAKD
jgi:hypothetical protein